MVQKRAFKRKMRTAQARGWRGYKTVFGLHRLSSVQKTGQAEMHWSNRIVLCEEGQDGRP